MNPKTISAMIAANRLHHTQSMVCGALLLTLALASCNNDKSSATTPRYTVTFNSQGGSPVPAATVEQGKTVAAPPEPTREGHLFGGWYKEAETTNIFAFATTPITGATILYAQWTALAPYTVTFHTGKGTLIAPLEPAAVKPGKTVTRPVDPAKTDSPFMEKDIEFVGWYADANLNNDQAFDFATTPITSDTTLYARYAYLISTEEQLAAVDNNLAGLYRLQRDIDLKTANWTPIGYDQDNAFTGRFEGGGYVIRNLKIDVSRALIGLFGVVGKGGVVQAIGLENVNIKGIAGVGALVGYNDGAVSGYAVGGTVEGDVYTGGLVGRNNQGIVIGYTWVKVVGSSSTGGLVGDNSDVATGYALGSVTCKLPSIIYSSYSGGLVGSNRLLIGYARGGVERRAGVKDNTFGLVAVNGLGGSTVGYHSGKVGESQLVGFTAGEQHTGYDGGAINYDATSKPTVDSFKGFTFGAAHGEWTWRDGHWPYINIEGIPLDRQNEITKPDLPATP